MGARPDRRKRPSYSSFQRGPEPTQKRNCRTAAEAAGNAAVDKVGAITPQALEPKDNELDAAHAFDITGARARLCAADGGYEIVHESRRLQVFVYALVAPEPDHQRVNADDELYIVLEGSGMLDVEGEQLELREGYAAFVPAGAHHCFSAYERLSVVAILEGRRGRSV